MANFSDDSKITLLSQAGMFAHAIQKKDIEKIQTLEQQAEQRSAGKLNNALQPRNVNSVPSGVLGQQGMWASRATPQTPQLAPTPTNIIPFTPRKP